MLFLKVGYAWQVQECGGFGMRRRRGDYRGIDPEAGSATILAVPIISTFFGIIIRMFFDDHAPPHFHAEHQGQDALVNFDGRILEGEITSPRARKLIKEWAQLHRFELEMNWRRAKGFKALVQIAPLE